MHHPGILLRGSLSCLLLLGPRSLFPAVQRAKVSKHSRVLPFSREPHLRGKLALHRDHSSLVFPSVNLVARYSPNLEEGCSQPTPSLQKGAKPGSFVECSPTHTHLPPHTPLKHQIVTTQETRTSRWQHAVTEQVRPELESQLWDPGQVVNLAKPSGSSGWNGHATMPGCSALP